MNYRKFGKTNLDVSTLGFGLMRLPIIDGDKSKIDEKQAEKLIDYAIDSGINYFDTAYPYHTLDFSKGGTSEPFFGKVLKKYNRQNIYISTKLPSWLVESREDMDKFLNLQLERLGTDYIDFYLLHGLNKKMWKNLQNNNALEFFDKSLESGKIKYAGFSFHDEFPLFKEIIDSYNWSFCQIQFNWFDENFQAGYKGLNYAAEKDIAVVIMEPLRGGSLVNRLPKAVKTVLNKSKTDRSEVEWALHWILKHEGISTILSGMSNMSQLKENIQLIKKLSEEKWSKKDSSIINQAKQILKKLQKIDCTACEYCLPCPEGVNISKNFALYNDAYMFNDPAAKMRYTSFLSKEEKASNCIQCGICLEKCPQQISIPDEMKNVTKLFR